MGFLSDYLLGKFAQFVEEKAKENPLYLKLTGKIGVDASNNKELNKLLEESIKNARSNSVIGKITDDEIKDSLDENVEILLECVVMSKEQISLSNFLIRLKYNNDNEDYRKRIETFYKSLYEQIHGNKENFPSLQNIQILKELEEIKAETRNNSQLLQEANSGVTTLITIANISYNEELSNIEKCISNREFIKARIIALAIEKKMIERNKREELEKFYSLLINTYLYEGDNQNDSIDYFDKLLAVTQDGKKRQDRKIIRYLLERDFKNAQKSLDEIFNNTTDEEIESANYESQINLFSLNGEFDKANDFINKNKDYIDKYQYFLALVLLQQYKIKEAHSLLMDNIQFFNANDYNIKEIKIQIQTHFLLDKIKDDITTKDIVELKELLTTINNLIAIAGDCRLKISYLHSLNAVILATIFETGSAIKEYEKALELDSNNMNAIRNYACLLLNGNEKIEEGIKLLKKYLEKYPNSFQDQLLYYSALIYINPNMVIQEISKMDNGKVELKLLLINAYDQVLNYSQSDSIINELSPGNEDNFAFHMCVGCHYSNLKDYSKAIDSFIKAYNLCKNEPNYDSVFYYLLRIICNQHYLDKIELVRNMLEEKYELDIILLKFSEYYIHILLVLNDYTTCISCCKKLRENNKNHPYIAEAEFASYYNTKNFQEVKKLILNSRINYTDEILIRIAFACASLGEFDLTKEILKKIKKPSTKEEYINISRLQFSIKEYQQSLLTINDAFISFSDDMTIQECYIRLVFCHGIHPESNDVAQSFIKCRDLYIASDYKDKTFDFFSIPKNATGSDILKLISEKFPDSKSLNIENRILQIQKNRLPITFYKLIYKENLFSIYNMVTNSNTCKIWCTEKYFSELNYIKELPIYIDLSSLITLDLVNLLGALKSVFPEVYITQSTMDEILIFDAALNEPYYTRVILHHNDVIQKPTEEIISTMRSQIENLKKFIKSNIKIIGTVLHPVNTLKEKINKFIKDYRNTDIAESETLQFCYISNYQCMLESTALRAVFNSLDNTPFSFGIDSLLKYLLDKQIITAERYYISISILIQNNYKQLPISTSHYLFIIRHEGYIISQKYSKSFEYFCSPEYDFSELYKSLGSLLLNIWNDPVPETKKVEWTDYLLGLIVMNQQMTIELERELIKSIGSHIKTKQDAKYFVDYLIKRYNLNIA